MPSASLHSIQIVVSVGCSMQVLECISSINQLATKLEQSSSDVLREIIIGHAEELENWLANLVQTPAVFEDVNTGHLDTTRIKNTVELYRLGALVYLHRSALHTPTRSPKMQNIVRASLHILKQTGICTSPWPLFIIACEVVCDSDRLQIMSTIEAMQQKRWIGNVDLIRGIIESVWKQIDLEEDSKARVGGKQLEWKAIVDVRPSFI